MGFLQMHFPVSGVETFVLLPPGVAFVISFFTSMAGISGAFLLLPFQVSVLGFAVPAVTATNFLYNVVGTPGGVWRYLSERRIPWPLVIAILGGTLPGVLLGYYFRVRFLPDPRAFKLFVGLVLLGVAARLVVDLARRPSARPPAREPAAVCQVSCGFRTASFSFMGRRYAFSVTGLGLTSLAVGILGGIYGIGGGAILAPFCVTALGLPVYAVAGAVLAANFTTSLAGVGIYSLIPLGQGQAIPPDWLLGIFFGLGGLAGMYLGAKCQRFVPEKPIKVILAVIVLTVAVGYVRGYFRL